MDGCRVCLKTGLANGLALRDEERKIEDKFYIWKIRNVVSGGAGEAGLEGKKSGVWF